MNEPITLDKDQVQLYGDEVEKLNRFLIIALKQIPDLYSEVEFLFLTCATFWYISYFLRYNSNAFLYGISTPIGLAIQSVETELSSILTLRIQTYISTKFKTHLLTSREAASMSSETIQKLYSDLTHVLVQAPVFLIRSVSGIIYVLSRSGLETIPFILLSLLTTIGLVIYKIAEDTYINNHVANQTNLLVSHITDYAQYSAYYATQFQKENSLSTIYDIFLDIKTQNSIRDLLSGVSLSATEDTNQANYEGNIAAFQELFGVFTNLLYGQGTGISRRYALKIPSIMFKSVHLLRTITKNVLASLGLDRSTEALLKLSYVEAPPSKILKENVRYLIINGYKFLPQTWTNIITESPFMKALRLYSGGTSVNVSINDLRIGLELRSSDLKYYFFYIDEQIVNAYRRTYSLSQFTLYEYLRDIAKLTDDDFNDLSALLLSVDVDRILDIHKTYSTLEPIGLQLAYALWGAYADNSIVVFENIFQNFSLNNTHLLHIAIKILFVKNKICINVTKETFPIEDMDSIITIIEPIILEAVNLRYDEAEIYTPLSSDSITQSLL